MQVLTNREIAQLNSTVFAAKEAIALIGSTAYEALAIADDFICHNLDRLLVAMTSDHALNLYRYTWESIKFTAIMAGGIAFYSGVLARDVWEFLCRYVDRCLEVKVSEEAQLDELLSTPMPEPVCEPLTVEELIALEESPTPQDEPIEDAWEVPASTVCLLASEVAIPASYAVPALPMAKEVVQRAPEEIAPTAEDMQPRKRGRGRPRKSA